MNAIVALVLVEDFDSGEVRSVFNDLINPLACSNSGISE
jgi:hypothetical protein